MVETLAYNTAVTPLGHLLGHLLGHPLNHCMRQLTSSLMQLLGEFGRGIWLNFPNCDLCYFFAILLFENIRKMDDEVLIAA